MKYKISFIKPSFPKASDIASDFDKIVKSNWFSNFGPYEQKLCNEVAEFVNKDIKVATVANATLAIDLAIRIIFDKSEFKNEVLVPSFTFAAGPEMLITNGYKPIFIDIDQKTWQPDIEQAREYILKNKNNIGGILLCNIFGVGNPDITIWEDLALEFETPLIIDSAAGFGSRYGDGSLIGSRGDCEIFSLHATKPFAVGEGGLILSRNAEVIERAKSLQNFGFDTDRHIREIGTNAKLTELSSAIGLRQLKSLASKLEKRQESLEHYKHSLLQKGYIFQPNDHISTVAFVSVVSPPSTDFDNIYTNLLNHGVEAKRYYRPLHQEKVFDDYTGIADNLHVTEYIASRIISLPLHDDMSHNDIKFITDLM